MSGYWDHILSEIKRWNREADRRQGGGLSSTDDPIRVEAPLESVLCSNCGHGQNVHEQFHRLGQSACITCEGCPKFAVNSVPEHMVRQMAQWCDALVLAMRAENISDETAARVLNRVVTGVPDPDAVITDQQQPAYPKIGTVREAAYDQLRDDIQRAAGRHVGD